MRRVRRASHSWEREWLAPSIAIHLPSIELPVGEGPQKGCREENERMGRYVNQHMESPGGEFPERPFEHEPRQEKRQEKYNEAVVTL